MLRRSITPPLLLQAAAGQPRDTCKYLRLALNIFQGVHKHLRRHETRRPGEDLGYADVRRGDGRARGARGGSHSARSCRPPRFRGRKGQKRLRDDARAPPQPPQCRASRVPSHTSGTAGRGVGLNVLEHYRAAMRAHVGAPVDQVSDYPKAFDTKELVAAAEGEDIVAPDAVRHVEVLRPGRPAALAALPAQSDEWSALPWAAAEK